MDIAVLETGNGGDIQIIGNNYAKQDGWGNMPYMALFGGNVAANTKEKFPTEQDFSWWGNNLLMPQDPSIQFNSLTERVLQDAPLNSAGRLLIEQAVKSDLKFMEDFAIISVSVSIISDSNVRLDIKIKQPEDLNGRIPDQYKAFIFIWDATKKALGDFRITDVNDDFFI